MQGDVSFKCVVPLRWIDCDYLLHDHESRFALVVCYWKGQCLAIASVLNVLVFVGRSYLEASVPRQQAC